MLKRYLACYIILNSCIDIVLGASKNGLLLLYRPVDVTNDCAFSDHLRYDLSFGMGMSDTITLVFRSLPSLDYECVVEIAAQAENDLMMVVVKLPMNLARICLVNRDAFMVLKKNKCLRLCDLLGRRSPYSSYFVMMAMARIRFRFLSNSSINTDINAQLYQVTATTARPKPKEGCNEKNETICTFEHQDMCFTNGVVCDGIKNCGVRDWFDERQSECTMPIEYLGYAPMVALLVALTCATLAAGHMLIRCLPPLTRSFFIFNANEDNRLCIDPVLVPINSSTNTFEKIKKKSLIPLYSSTSNSSSEIGSKEERPEPSTSASVTQREFVDKTTKSIKAKIQAKIYSVTGRVKTIQPSSMKIPADV